MISVRNDYKVKIHNLGEIATKVKGFVFQKEKEGEDIMEDMDAFYAPTECSDLAFKNFDKEMEEGLKNILGEFNLTWGEYTKELRARCKV